MGRLGAADRHRRHADAGEDPRTTQHQTLDRGGTTWKGPTIGRPGRAIAALMHPQPVPVAQGGALKFQYNPLAPVGEQLLEDVMEHRTTLPLQCLVGGGTSFQVFPDLPGFIGRGVAMQQLVSGRRQGRIEARRHRENHHVALGPDAPLPVAHPDAVNRQIGELLAAAQA